MVIKADDGQEDSHVLAAETLHPGEAAGASKVPTPRSLAQLVPHIANYSIQYNLVGCLLTLRQQKSCAAIALEIMATADNQILDDRQTAVSDHGDTPLATADFPPPEWVHYVLLGLVFAGAVVGMCLMGYLGDLMGRQRAMVVTLSLTVVGALWSALASWGSPSTVYAMIAVGRTVLGIGVGGIYPLSAVHSAESSTDRTDGGQRVGWAFFWQTPGAMTPYLLTLILLLLPSGAQRTSLQFRLIFGLGAVPAMVVLYGLYRDLTGRQHQTRSLAACNAGTRTHATLMRAIWSREHLRMLLGTAGTWFIYDINFYGINIFTPHILKDIFGESNTLLSTSWQSLVVTALGVPGAICAILLLRPKGARWLNIYGFLLICLAFVAMAVAYEASPDGLQTAKFLLFCVLTFALNFGPNVATFVLPTLCFDPEVRATFHGLSAAAAKLGAVVGTYLFPVISAHVGVAVVMWMQAALALVGMLLAIFLVQIRPQRVMLPAIQTLAYLPMDEYAWRDLDEGAMVHTREEEYAGNKTKDSTGHEQRPLLTQ